MFGGIRKLPSGRWQATYWQDGKQHAATFARKADASAHLADMETTVRRGQWADPEAANVPFREYAEAWLAGNVKRGRIRPTTEAKYRGLLDRHILPTFGDTYLSKISVATVRAWYADLAAKHQPTAAGSYRLLATIFNSVVRDELLFRSPCKVEGGSRERSSERPVATVGECQTAVNATPPQFRAAIMLAAWGQLRRGEVLALRRRDINIKAGSVTVARAWLLTEQGRTILGDPKTDAGKRTVHLPQHVIAAVEQHLDAHVRSDDDALLFPGTNGEPMHPRTFSRVWNTARAAVDRPDLRFHDLRHSGLTWVAQAGATTAELMRRGGHSSPVAANRYQHASDDRDRALADVLGHNIEAG